MVVGWRDLWRVFGRIGLLSFGGPAAQIALMHRILVDERRWLTEADYLRALSFCMLLPGPEAMQLATYSGWRLRGTAGGLLAGMLFVLPGAVILLALAVGYVAWGQIPLVAALFQGVKACVVVIVIEALLRVARRALKTGFHRALALLAFAGLFLFNLPFPAIILAAALLGATRTAALLAADLATPLRHGRLPMVVAVGLALWFTPLVLLHLGGQTFLTELGLFFSRLAVVTFGGAYAVLAYMAQTVVQTFGWVSAPQMMDALGLAETTPGPLILVTEFVAFLAGHAQGGTGLALVAAGLTLWVTFVPCFLWIFAFAPYIEWIATRPRLQAALSGVTAAVVGVIGNLALWFALQVLFTRTTVVDFGPLHLLRPDPASIDLSSVIIAAGAAILLLRLHLPLLAVLGAAALAGVGLAGVGLF